MSKISALESFLKGDLDEWLGALPEYQEATIKEMMSQGKSEEEVAVAWLSASGPQHTAPFGALFDRQAFFERLLNELELFLCNGGSYDQEREQLLEEINPKQAYVVGFIATVVAPVVGAAAPLIAPAIALIAFTIGRMGVQAWCGMRQELRAQTD